MWLGYFYSEW